MTSVLPVGAVIAPAEPVDSDEVLAEALFMSRVDESDHPTAEMVARVIAETKGRLGVAGCAECVAQEFGDHPDCACRRMGWARTVILAVYHPDGVR